jgi:PhnB protein
MPVNFIPDGYHTVTPYLVVDNVAQVLEFAKKAFDAKESHPPMRRPDGGIAHAEVQIGDSRVMMGERNAQFPAMPGMLYLYVPDVDASYRRAIEAGGVSVAEPADQFYGDRHGGVKDACGNQWWVATHKEDVPFDEMMRRAAAQGKKA